jgi:hypothetical protein
MILKRYRYRDPFLEEFFLAINEIAFSNYLAVISLFTHFNIFLAQKLLWRV